MPGRQCRSCAVTSLKPAGGLDCTLVQVSTAYVFDGLNRSIHWILASVIRAAAAASGVWPDEAGRRTLRCCRARPTFHRPHRSHVWPLAHSAGQNDELRRADAAIGATQQSVVRVVQRSSVARRKPCTAMSPRAIRFSCSPPRLPAPPRTGSTMWPAAALRPGTNWQPTCFDGRNCRRHSWAYQRPNSATPARLAAAARRRAQHRRSIKPWAAPSCAAGQESRSPIIMLTC